MIHIPARLQQSHVAMEKRSLPVPAQPEYGKKKAEGKTKKKKKKTQNRCSRKWWNPFRRKANAGVWKDNLYRHFMESQSLVFSPSFIHQFIHSVSFTFASTNRKWPFRAERRQVVSHTEVVKADGRMHSGKHLTATVCTSHNVKPWFPLIPGQSVKASYKSWTDSNRNQVVWKQQNTWTAQSSTINNLGRTKHRFWPTLRSKSFQQLA